MLGEKHAVTSWYDSARMLIVLGEGGDARLFDRSTRDRNRRVAARLGATIVDLADLPRYHAQPALLIPADLVINALLFNDPRVTRAIDAIGSEPGHLPCWLESSANAAALLGPAAGLARLVQTSDSSNDLPRVPVDADGLLSVATPEARRHAAWRILMRTAKPTDGWVSRTFNRPMSRPISYVMLAVGLKADHASLLTLLVGVGAALVAAQPGYWSFVITGVLFQLASMLDGVDGEMARATLTESDAGARLDTLVDQLTYLACFAGVTVGWVRENGGRSALIWTVLIGALLLVSLGRAGRFVQRHSKNASFVLIDRSVRRAARDTGQSMLRLAARGFTLLRRDVFAAVFLGVALTGQRVLVPALVMAGVVLANVTFSFYRRELAAAARAEQLPAV